MTPTPQAPRTRAAFAVLSPFLLLLILLAAGGFLAGCGSCAPAPDQPGAGADASSVEPVRGGTLVVGLRSQPDSLNVYLARAVESLLVANRVLPRLWAEVLPDAAHPDGLVPELVSGPYSLSADGLELRIPLRQDVRWSDGSPLVCEDVLFTHQAQIDPALGWRAASVKRHIKDVACPGPHEVVIRFDQAYPDAVSDVNTLHILPRSLTSIPRGEWRGIDWAARLPAAGPFTIGAVVPDQSVTLARREGFDPVGARPYLDAIVFRVMPDSTSRLLALLSGDLDIATDLLPDEAEKVAQDGSITLIRRPGANYLYLGWNTLDGAAYSEYTAKRQAECKSKGEDPCLDDPGQVADLARRRPHRFFGDARVRRAMTLAIDRETLLAAALRGEGEIPPSPILSPLPEHDPNLKPLAADPKAARALLEEAGFADADADGTLDRGGKPFAFELVVHAGDRLRGQIAQLIQQDLGRIGIAMSIRPVASSAFYPSLQDRTMDAWLGKWLTSTRVDMTEMLHRQACGNQGSNFGSWSHDEADRIALQARETLDPSARAALWRQWEAHFASEQPYTMLLRENRVVAVRNRVKGTESLLATDFLHGVEGWWIDTKDR